MKAIRAVDLSKILKIPRRTICSWCKADPALAYKDRDGVYHIRIAVLAKRPGFDLIAALTLESSRWIKAVDLATLAGAPRRTISYWCANRPRFARRIGKVWYIDLEAVGATEEQVEALRTWTPNQRTAIAMISATAFLKKAAT